MKDFLSPEDIDGSRLLLGALFLAARIVRGTGNPWQRELLVEESLADADALMLAAARRSPLEASFGKDSTPEHGR